MIRIGIPRALLYYQYYPMWKAFFEELGAEVVVSSTTTQAMLAEGASRVVAETCLPVKVFLGHVFSLVGECDRIFIPVIRSMGNKVYNCSKFLGLPDMTKAVVPEAPPILDIDIDINEGKWMLYQDIYRLGRYFTWNPVKVRQASLAAQQAYLDFRELMTGHKLTPPEVLVGMSELEASDTPAVEYEVPRHPDSMRATIAVIGHPYLLYDKYITHRLIHRLEQAGNKVLTPEMLTNEELQAGIARLAGRAYWTYEEEVTGAGEHYLQNGVDGVIGIMAFGCGPDSLMMDMVRRQAVRRRTTPFMNLTLEEHTAEAGLITRMEAFVEMIYRKKRKNVDVCV